MKKSAAILAAPLALGLWLAAAPAHADAFSLDSFAGSPSTFSDLPGVRFDAPLGGQDAAASGNCVQRPSSFVDRRTGLAHSTMNECNFGRFSFSTSSGGMGGPGVTRYHGMPAPNEIHYGGWRR